MLTKSWQNKHGLIKKKHPNHHPRHENMPTCSPSGAELLFIVTSSKSSALILLSPPKRSGEKTHLNATLPGELDCGVVVATAQQMLHHHTVHAFPLPHTDVGRLVTAVLLQMFNAPLTEFSALILCLDGLCRLQKMTRF